MNNNFEYAKRRISNNIDNTILYSYGEAYWYGLTKRKRKEIIENLVRDQALYHYLSESETNRIIQSEWSKC